MKMVYTAEGTKAKRKLDCILDQKFYPACLGGTLDKPVSVWMMESQREMELSISQVNLGLVEGACTRASGMCGAM